MSRGWIVLALAVSISGCGYALAGHVRALPKEVRRIGLPGFQNHSDAGDLGRVFTDAVRAEFNSRGGFVVVPETTGVDAVLTGDIRSVNRTAAATTVTGGATKYNIVVTASAEFKLATDIAPKPPYYTNPSLMVYDEYNQPSDTALTDLATFFSQNQNALDRLAKAFASKLVTSILEKF